MERGLIVFVAALVLHASPAVQGTSHLSFDNRTQVNVTRARCVNLVTNVCLEEPSGCDPTGNGSCLFLSVVARRTVAPRSANLSIQLQGDFDGYVALGLSLNRSEDSALLFVCAANKTTPSGFFFRTVTRNNSDALIPNERIVSNIRSRVNGRRIACEFDIPDVNAASIAASIAATSPAATSPAATSPAATSPAATSPAATSPATSPAATSPATSAAATSIVLLLGTGTVSPGGDLGPFNVSMRTGLLDLADPTPSPTPANTTRPNAAIRPHAAVLMLIVLSVSAVLSGRS